MFIRRKVIGGRERFYLVENTRQDGKVKQKVLAYLGDKNTIEAAIEQRERWINSYMEMIAKRTRKIDDMKAQREEYRKQRAAESGKPYTPQEYPKPEKGQRYYSGVYQYWRFVEDIERYKHRIHELEEQIDKLTFYCSA